MEAVRNLLHNSKSLVNTVGDDLGVVSLVLGKETETLFDEVVVLGGVSGHLDDNRGRDQFVTRTMFVLLMVASKVSQSDWRMCQLEPLVLGLSLEGANHLVQQCDAYLGASPALTERSAGCRCAISAVMPSREG